MGTLRTCEGVGDLVRGWSWKYLQSGRKREGQKQYEQTTLPNGFKQKGRPRLAFLGERESGASLPHVHLVFLLPHCNQIPEERGRGTLDNRAQPIISGTAPWLTVTRNLTSSHLRGKRQGRQTWSQLPKVPHLPSRRATSRGPSVHTHT